jgi:type IV secretory pathway VirB10-like protein
VLFSHNLIHESVPPIFKKPEAVEEMVTEAGETKEKEAQKSSNRKSSRSRSNTKSSKRAQDRAKNSKNNNTKNDATANNNNHGDGNSSSKHVRFVLRSDLMTKRLVKPLGFSLHESGLELQDYELALNYFRDAQWHEMEKRDAGLAGALYERALSLRYAYPLKLRAQLQLHQEGGENGMQIEKENKWNNPFPGMILSSGLFWAYVFIYLFILFN